MKKGTVQTLSYRGPAWIIKFYQFLHLMCCCKELLKDQQSSSALWARLFHIAHIIILTGNTDTKDIFWLCVMIGAFDSTANTYRFEPTYNDHQEDFTQRMHKNCIKALLNDFAVSTLIRLYFIFHQMPSLPNCKRTVLVTGLASTVELKHHSGFGSTTNPPSTQSGVLTVQRVIRSGYRKLGQVAKVGQTVNSSSGYMTSLQSGFLLIFFFFFFFFFF